MPPQQADLFQPYRYVSHKRTVSSFLFSTFLASLNGGYQPLTTSSFFRTSIFELGYHLRVVHFLFMSEWVLHLSSFKFGMFGSGLSLTTLHIVSCTSLTLANFLYSNMGSQTYIFTSKSKLALTNHSA